MFYARDSGLLMARGFKQYQVEKHIECEYSQAKRKDKGLAKKISKWFVFEKRYISFRLIVR